MFSASLYLGYKQAQKGSISQAIVKGAIGVLIITGLTYLSSGNTFGRLNKLYTAIVFVLAAGGYLVGILIEKLKLKI